MIFLEVKEYKGVCHELHFEQPVEVYDPAGNLIAYNVNIVADKQAAGFVMVSAFLDEEPILMWSDAGSSFDPKNVKADLKYRSTQVIGEKVVWLGGVNFAGQFLLTNGNEAIVDSNGTVKTGKVDISYPSPKRVE